jgi:hypothetical protein
LRIKTDLSPTIIFPLLGITTMYKTAFLMDLVKDSSFIYIYILYQELIKGKTVYVWSLDSSSDVGSPAINSPI